MKRRTNTSSAVKQQRAAKVQEADTPQQALYRALNYFPTPVWAARAGGEIIRQIDPLVQSAWEPACGGGHMAHGLGDYFETVRASDIYAHGYGDVIDFLMLDHEGPGVVDWIITNPPFDKAEEFLAKALKMARRGVALLCRVAFLEGAGRYAALFGSNGPDTTPLTLCAVFSERVPMVLGAWDPSASSAGCYAWFFFQKGQGTNGGARLIAIPPGTHERLHKRDDVVRFAKLADAPLFDRVAPVQEENLPETDLLENGESVLG